MVSVIYFGKDKRMVDYLRYIPGRAVLHAETYKEVEELCRKHTEVEHFVVLMERRGGQHDITAAGYLHHKIKGIYIVMFAEKLRTQERLAFLRAGVNDTMSPNATLVEVVNKIRFVDEHERNIFARVELMRRTRGYSVPWWKRAFDIVFASTALVCLSPLLLVTAIAIYVESPGPIWYKSKRVGANYHVFDFLKFRSMRVGADKQLKQYAALNQYAAGSTADTSEAKPLIDDTAPIAEGTNIMVGDDTIMSEEQYQEMRNRELENAFVKLENDPRITRVGRFIRKYSIDELPQLINILKGDMSVVGNRPLPLYEAEKLTDDDSIDRFIAPAGLTGLWQVEKRGQSGRLSAEERKQLDITYGQTYNILLDIKILFKTCTAFIQKENV